MRKEMLRAGVCFSVQLKPALDTPATSELPDAFKELVNEYESVFPTDLPPVPPDRLITHKIDLKPGAEPIHKRPYRMSPDELE